MVAVPVADRLRLPYPILLLVFGLVLAVVPGVSPGSRWTRN